jgi:TetR/AcrR family transcriptional repressor of mexJK operon
MTETTTLSPSPARTREKPEVRRQAILDAARAVFLERGYTDTSIDAVVERAGGSKATIYSMFGNKEGLFSAVVAICGEDFSAAIEAVPICASPRESLRRIARKYLAVVLDPERMAMFRMVAGDSSRKPEAGDIFYRLGPQAGLEIVTKLFRECGAKRHVDPDEPEKLADYFLGALRGHLFLATLLNPTRAPTQTEIDRHIDYVVDTFLRGCPDSAGKT